MRIRVVVDVRKPLFRCLKVGSLGGASLTVTFTYERLPFFCYTCGILGHIARYCEHQYAIGQSGTETEVQYGPWLYAANGRGNFWRYIGGYMAEERWNGRGDLVATSNNAGVVRRRGASIFNPTKSSNNCDTPNPVPRKDEMSVNVQKPISDSQKDSQREIESWLMGPPLNNHTIQAGLITYIPMSKSSNNSEIQFVQEEINEAHIIYPSVGHITRSDSLPTKQDTMERCMTPQVESGQQDGVSLLINQNTASSNIVNDMLKNKQNLASSGSQAEQPPSLSLALAEVPIIFEPGKVSSTELRKPIRKFVTKPKSAGHKRKLPVYMSSPQSKKYKPSVVFLSETKCNRRKFEDIRSKFDMFGIEVTPRGRSGGLMLLWDKNLTVQIRSYSTDYIDADIYDDEVSEGCRFTSFYGNPEVARRKASWEKLIRLSQESTKP
ncbi:UNVERIFIED_CONTAM: hypothetical protein Sradi_5706600 [Sesamum radiatum]|uniref:CCHC-type domain-containing protein n=1 Tax=Sesamum radiatum TaxID=300843 RepID=A0AAW2L4Z4_SESRA